jgi:hypothetical protein
VIRTRGAGAVHLDHGFAALVVERGARHVQQVLRGVGAEDRDQRAAQVAVARGAQGLAPVDQHADLDLGKAERQRRHHLHARRGFGAARAQELAAGRKAREQTIDHHSGPGLTR